VRGHAADRVAVLTGLRQSRHHYRRLPGHQLCWVSHIKRGRSVAHQV